MYAHPSSLHVFSSSTPARAPPVLVKISNAGPAQQPLYGSSTSYVVGVMANIPHDPYDARVNVRQHEVVEEVSSTTRRTSTFSVSSTRAAQISAGPRPQTMQSYTEEELPQQYVQRRPPSAQRFEFLHANLESDFAQRDGGLDRVSSWDHDYTAPQQQQVQSAAPIRFNSDMAVQQARDLTGRAMDGLRVYKDMQEHMGGENRRLAFQNERLELAVGVLQERFLDMTTENQEHLEHTRNRLMDYAATLEGLLPKDMYKTNRGLAQGESSFGSERSYDPDLSRRTSSYAQSSKSFDPATMSVSSRASSHAQSTRFSDKSFDPERASVVVRTPERTLFSPAASQHVRVQLTKEDMQSFTSPLQGSARVLPVVVVTNDSIQQTERQRAFVEREGMVARVIHALTNEDYVLSSFGAKVRDMSGVQELMWDIMTQIKAEYVWLFDADMELKHYVQSIDYIELYPATFSGDTHQAFLLGHDVGCGYEFIPAGLPSASIDLFRGSRLCPAFLENKETLWVMYMRQFLNWNTETTIALTRLLQDEKTRLRRALLA